MHTVLGGFVGFALCALSLASAADETEALTAVQLDPEKLAGVGLPAEEPWVAPEDLLSGSHDPRGEILFAGEQVIVEVYEDDEATFAGGDGFLFDEFVLILSGKLVLTNPDGVVQEFVAGDSLVVPKGYKGTWEMQGDYRELVVIERKAYEEAYGEVED
jgi:hypothetical protein